MIMSDEFPEHYITRDEYIAISRMSEKEVVASYMEWDKAHPHTIRGLLSAWESIRTIAICHQQFLGGDKGALLYAQHLCLLDSLPPPLWIIKAQLHAYRQVNHFKVKSWDDVYGKPFKKNVQLAALRKRRILAIELYLNIITLKKRDPKIVINDALFAAEGKKLNLGKTLAAEYYSYAKKRFGYHNINE